MQRRTLLKLGVGSAVLLTLAGGGLALLRPGLSEGRLTAAGREVFLAVARAVLDGVLPDDANARAAVLTHHLQRLDETVAAFPAATQSELSQLLALLASTAGRLGLARLRPTWLDADVSELQQALQGMRTASLALPQQAYHALRDLTNAAYFADAATWAPLGYPGPRAVEAEPAA
jgi:hypothetical protein